MIRILVSTADPTIGRFDTNMLSDQACMELLIENIADETKAYFQDKDGAFLDIGEWRGVTIDDIGNITQVSFTATFRGTFSLAYIPRRVKQFKINMCRAHGSLETATLPEGIEKLFLKHTQMSGTIDLRQVPASLTHFDVVYSSFSGSCDLTALPPKMVMLDLSHNAFSGEISLDSLPETMQCLYLYENSFCGEISLEKLPRAMTYLNISGNKLCGQFTLLRPMPVLDALHADRNNFAARVRVHSSLHGVVSLGENVPEITECIDEKGKTVFR